MTGGDPIGISYTHMKGEKRQGQNVYFCNFTVAPACMHSNTGFRCLRNLFLADYLFGWGEPPAHVAGTCDPSSRCCLLPCWSSNLAAFVDSGLHWRQEPPGVILLKEKRIFLSKVTHIRQ